MNAQGREGYWYVAGRVSSGAKFQAGGRTHETIYSS